MELLTASNYAFLSHTFPPVKNNCKVDIDSKMYIHSLDGQAYIAYPMCPDA